MRRLLSQGARLLQESPRSPHGTLQGHGCASGDYLKFQYWSVMVFNCHPLIRPPSYQVSAPSLPMPYLVSLYFHQGALSPDKHCLGRLVLIRGLPRPSSPKAAGNQRGCLHEYQFKGKPAQLFIPLSRIRDQRGAQASLKHKQTDVMAQLRGALAHMPDVSCSGYGVLSVGPGRSADQGLGEASTLLSCCCYQQAAPLWRLVLAEPQRALLAHRHLSHGPVTRTSGLSFPPQNTELLLLYSTARHRTTNGPAYVDQMLALVLAPRQH